MPEIKRYRKKPVECEAIELRAFGDFTRARDWMLQGGTKGHHYVGDLDSKDHLVFTTVDGNLVDIVDGYLVKGIQGEFYPCRKDIFEASHECVEVVKDEARPGSGTDVPRSPGSILTGGAAKKLGLASD